MCAGYPDECSAASVISSGVSEGGPGVVAHVNSSMWRVVLLSDDRDEGSMNRGRFLVMRSGLACASAAPTTVVPSERPGGGTVPLLTRDRANRLSALAHTRYPAGRPEGRSSCLFVFL